MLKLQQTVSKLGAAVFRKSGSGESIKFPRLGTLEMTDIIARGGETVATDLTTENRWVRPQAAEACNRLDEFDEEMLGQISQPNSQIIATHAAAVNRKIDNVIIAAATGTAYTGKNGTDTVAFSSAMEVAVGYVPTGSATNSGMTLYKIAQAAYLMDVNEVPEEGRYLAMTAKQRKDLIDDIIANHSDDSMARDWANRGYKNGESILGFTVIVSQRCVLTTATDVRTCPFWHKDAIGLGVWSDKKTHMDILPTFKHALQIRTTMNVGATRIEELAVGAIYADESP
jgi:hypothetical protein